MQIGFVFLGGDVLVQLSIAHCLLPAHCSTLDRPAAVVRNMGIAAPAEQT
jgi:hypothetical protein